MVRQDGQLVNTGHFYKNNQSTIYMTKNKFTWTKGWNPVFKKNNHKHESGYNCFTVGYKNFDTQELHIIGNYTDHIWLANELEPSYNMSLDVQDDGWIRVFGYSINYKWQYDNSGALSTMQIVSVE